MGNNSSQEEQEKVGYRVLGVQPNSPAAKGGLVSFFDFIIAANGVPLRSLDSTFVELIKGSENKPLPLTVYNCKSHTIRDVTLIPSRNWPGEGMLGVVIRFDTYHEAEEHMCHVIDVESNSPAELAGLQAGNDFLLGTAELAFRDTDDLFAVLQANLDKPVEFYVYNSETDEVRVCILMPSATWGGEGILGASVAHGYLHSFPSSCCQTLGRTNDSGTNIFTASQSPFGVNFPQNPASSTACPSSSQQVVNVMEIDSGDNLPLNVPETESTIQESPSEQDHKVELTSISEQTISDSSTQVVKDEGADIATNNSHIGTRLATFFNPADIQDRR